MNTLSPNKATLERVEGGIKKEEKKKGAIWASRESGRGEKWKKKMKQQKRWLTGAVAFPKQAI